MASQEDKEEEEEKPVLTTLNTANSATSMWLVKVPFKWILNTWSSVPADTVLGKVIIQEEANKKNNVFITLEPSTLDQNKYTLESFQVIEQPLPGSLKVISEDIQGNVAIEGTVEKKVDLKAQDRSRFIDRVKIATSQLDNRGKPPLVKIHDPDAREKRAVVFPNTITGSKRKRDERGVVERRVPVEEEKLREFIFQLFKEKDNWTLKDMNDRLQQPEKHFKEVLSKLCDYNKAGKLKATYSLKGEYRDGPKKPETEDQMNQRPMKKFRYDDPDEDHFGDGYGVTHGDFGDGDDD